MKTKPLTFLLSLTFLFLFSGSVYGDTYNETFKGLKLAAEQGDAVSQNNLGWMYDKGNGVMQNYQTAFKWYKRSSEQGWPVAQFNLGWLYSKGHGVDKDLVRAYMWWHNSGTLGYDHARKHKRLLEKELKPVALAKAKYLARECGIKKYKEC